MSDPMLRGVIDIVASIAGIDAEVVTSATRRDDVELWDSFAQLNIMVALEDEFDIELAPDDIEYMASIGDIVALIQGRVN